MNYLDNKSPIIYTSSILGNNLSVATGVAQTVNKQDNTINVDGYFN